MRLTITAGGQRVIGAGDVFGVSSRRPLPFLNAGGFSSLRMLRKWRETGRPRLPGLPLIEHYGIAGMKLSSSSTARARRRTGMGQDEFVHGLLQLIVFVPHFVFALDERVREAIVIERLCDWRTVGIHELQAGFVRGAGSREAFSIRVPRWWWIFFRDSYPASASCQRCSVSEKSDS